MKLSIIIPYYNSKEYTDVLLARLAPQVNPEVEVILVDDASPEPYKTSYDWLKIVRHKKNQKAAGARNTGLAKAKGDYVQFIDSDDMIPDYFIARLFREMKENPFDVCDYSWKSLTEKGVQHNMLLRDKVGRLYNPSVCTRCFSREYIGKTRFNTHKDSTEDEDFSRHLGFLLPGSNCRHTAISEYMYFYRTSVDMSNSKKFKAGLRHTKRIAYYLPEVTADRTDLLEEIKLEDINNEVWLLTERCDIPELYQYCQIHEPFKMWAHEARGQYYPGIEVIKPPIQTQVVVWCGNVPLVGGISTFVYAFCFHMRKYYDIVVLYKEMDMRQVARLRKIVQVEHISSGRAVICDTLILNRLNDEIPKGVSYKQSVQVCHCCKQEGFSIPRDRNVLVNVSESSKASWAEESSGGVVINNMIVKEEKESLFLVSATRIGARDKNGNEERMATLAKMLRAAGIPFVWLNFSNHQLPDMPDGFVNMGPEPADVVQAFIKRADYLVQLSGVEAWSYSAMEALINQTAVICTPFGTLDELGIIDGVNAHVLPMDMEFDVTKLLDVPKVEYTFDNTKRIRQWKKILGNTKPTGNYVPAVGPKLVKARIQYRDIVLNRILEAGEMVEMPIERVEDLLQKGLVEVVT